MSLKEDFERLNQFLEDHQKKIDELNKDMEKVWRLFNHVKYTYKRENSG